MSVKPHQARRYQLRVWASEIGATIVPAPHFDHGLDYNVRWDRRDTSRVVSVTTAHGHSFITEDELEVCLFCGAAYELLADADDPTHGEYVTASGDEPMYCSGDTSMDHGYEAESVCNCVRCC